MKTQHCLTSWSCFLCFALTAPLGLFITSCGISGPLREDPKAANFEFGEVGGDWKIQKSPEANADFVYENSKNGSFFAINSVCNRYPDSTLEALTRQLMVPIEKATVIEQNRITLDGRDALITRTQGFLDGVPVESLSAVIRKNECIFDFTLNARDRIPAEDSKIFDRVIRGFRFVGGVKK